MKVLLVEDDDGYAMAMEHLLRACKLDVTRVATLRAALTEAETMQPDVILLDLGLPDSQIADTARAIPEFRKRAPEAHVAVMTGSTDPIYKHLSMESGADTFTEKGGMGSRRDILHLLIESLKNSNNSIQKNVEILEQALGQKLL